ncbi:MAG: outer membrane protein assembly factor BamB [Limisphaerales bacterium]|jgi:outer membrane protein assembly factor BamB
MKSSLRRLFFATILILGGNTLTATDWPMWRYDAEHRAASPEELPATLNRHWTIQLSPREPVWDDPLNQDLMPYDQIFEPIVLGDRMFVTFNDSDKVVAFDTDNGAELWRFHTDGPVRLPPVGHQSKVYIVSDDGYLYCLAADTGKLRWKFRGGPSALKVLGNKRVISAWPARGGPVVRDGRIYFAASVWPFMGTFIYALDANTGDVVWVNDSTGAQYIKQPHSAPSFAGVAPQGTLVATEKHLLVPGGRSVPAAFDRATGEFVHFEINAGGKGNGGSFVVANGAEYFVHTRLRGVRNYTSANGKKGSFTCNEPVLTKDFFYAAADIKGVKSVTALNADKKKIGWSIPADGSGDLIKAGRRLYAAGTNSLTAIDLPAGTRKARIAWTKPIEADVKRLIAANGKLISVSLDGRISAYAAGSAPQKLSTSPTPAAVPDKIAARRANQLLREVEMPDGYALWFGVDDVDLLQSVLAQSKLRIIAVDPDPEKVRQLRDSFESLGLYGKRVTVHQGTPTDFQAPPYITSLAHVGNAPSARLNPAEVKTLYNSVRPYGGILNLACSKSQLPAVEELIKRADLKNAEIQITPLGIQVVRTGALPDSADWTHQYGDIANSVKSDDSRLKLPLGVLWFGGSSNMDVLPRHGHGPPEQVIGGRMFIEGINSLSARDVYTGRVLWIRRFEDLGTFGIYYNETYKDTPLDPAYNQKHIPGANGRGANYVATEDAVYLAIADGCHVLDPQTGNTRQIIRLSKGNGQSEAPQWGFIGTYDDLLLAGNGFANFSRKYAAAGAPIKPSIEDYSASAGLVAFDRHTGARLWEFPARHSLLHNGIIAGDGRVHVLDKLPKSAEDKLKRRGGKAPADYRIVTLDSRTGKILWTQEENIFGTWLSYSDEHDIVLQAGAKASDRLRDEVSQGLITYRGKDGSVLWKRLDLNYSGPCILHNDKIITNADQHSNKKSKGNSSTVFSLLDGSDQSILNPLTGELEPWRIVRGKGCNSIIASEHFLTFRDGAASYYDLETRNGIGSFGGFKSGCTANLIVANGVLNAPDYTRTCSCSYQNQTSLALIHMPDVELWTSSLLGAATADSSLIKRLGVNLGAPGDRQSKIGTMWLDYPSVGGRSPAVTVDIAGNNLSYFRQHASAVDSEVLPWVLASGARNVQKVTIRPEIAAAESAKSSGANTIVASKASATAEENARGKVTLTSSDLELTEDKGVQQVGILFRNLPFKRGAQIPPTSIRFTVDETGSKLCRLTIRAETSDNAQEFTTGAKNVSTRKLSKTSVSWTPAPWTKGGESGPKQTTPDLARLMTEVINRPGWKKGNSIAFIISGSGKRVAKSRTDGPKLIIESGEQPAPAQPQITRGAGRDYTVVLYFSDPDRLRVGERGFDVALQGKTVIQRLDLAKTVEPRYSYVKRVAHVRINDTLEITLSKIATATHEPVLSGVELIAE